MLTYNRIEDKLRDQYESLELALLKKEEQILQKLQNEMYQNGQKGRRAMKYKKHYIMRESDIRKLPVSVRKNYDVSFKPLTRDYFERRTTWFYLKGKKYLGDQYAMYEYPKDMLRRITNIPLFTTDYLNWLVKYNDNEELVIRAGLRQPESRLGLGVFKEKQNDSA
jgi:hypothetical protein